MESSPTRSTRDLPLKVVPAAARVSLHLLLNPPRSPRPRPLSGVAASTAAHFSFRPSQPGLRRSPPGPGSAEPGPRAVRPFAFSRRPKGGGARKRRTELEWDAVNRTRAPTGKMLGPPGGNAWAAGCIHPRDPLSVPQTVVLWDLEIQGRCSHTRRARLGAFIFWGQKGRVAGEAGGGVVEGAG